MQDNTCKWPIACIIERLLLSINPKSIVFTGELNVDIYETKGDSQGKNLKGEEREAAEARSGLFQSRFQDSG